MFDVGVVALGLEFGDPQPQKRLDRWPPGLGGGGHRGSARRWRPGREGETARDVRVTRYRTSADRGHAPAPISLLSCEDAGRRDRGCVTTGRSAVACRSGAWVGSSRRLGVARRGRGRRGSPSAQGSWRCAAQGARRWVARVTRCIRSSSWRVLRQVSPVAFSTTRISSSASQQSWTWAPAWVASRTGPIASSRRGP